MLNGLKICQSLTHCKMSKKRNKNATSNTTAPIESESAGGPITQDKSKNILIQILAKPGAKDNGVTGITGECVGIRINAPPTEGEANAELIKYLSSVLGVRKGDISLVKGFKSKQKTIKIEGEHSLTQIQEKLKQEVTND